MQIQKRNTYIRDIYTQEGKFYYGLYCHLLHIQSKECVIEIFALSFISFFFLFLSLYRGYTFIPSSEYFYAEIHMTKFPVTRHNNLRFKLDCYSNVFVKVDVHERAISEDKLSPLKFQRCSSQRMQTVCLLTFRFRID